MISIKIIAAIDHQMTIGNEGRTPWYLPEDLGFFKEVTWGNPVIMGRKTFQAIGKPLPGRDNIVLTQNPDFSGEGIETAHSIEEGLGFARHLSEEVYIAGGARVYEQFLPQADEMFLTIVHDTFEGDRFFPDFAISEWHPVRIDTYKQDERHSSDFTWWKLESESEKPHWCSRNTGPSRCPYALSNDH
jgi:dihydrofolate reductase